jgi:PAS domain S-box-containing protein
MVLQDLISEIFQINNGGLQGNESNINDTSSLDDEQFYELLMLVVPGGLSIATDKSCKRIIHNPRAARFLRINDFEDFSHSVSQPPPVKIFSKGKELAADEMPIQQAANDNELIMSVELEFIWEDGIHKTALWSARPFLNKNGEVTGVIASFEEITHQKQVEELLRKQKLIQKDLSEKAQELSNQAKLLELAHDYILVRDKNSDINFWNSSAEKGYGWTRQEVLGNNKYELLKTQFPTSFKEMQNELLTNGYWEGDLIHTKKDGTEISVESRQSVIKDEHDEVVAFLEINRDITERKKMENSLKENEERFRSCFDNMLDCIHIYTAVRDKSGSITDFLIDYSNEAACLARKMSKEELYGRSYLELFHNYVKTELFYEYCKVVETGEPLIRYEKNYYNALHKHISGVYDYRAFKFEDGLVLSWRDITEQKKLEQEIIRLDKLNLVGEMAAGIGHEVRNPMTTVKGFLQLLSTKEECSQYKDYYTLMIEELDRANSIITEFLRVAKDKVVEFKMESLKQIVENILPLIQSDATVSDKYIYVELEEVQEIPLDKKEIHQLVINLARNGLEAMPPGGSLKIRTFVEKETIVLSVQNNGPGIPQEVLEKIGTSFFTTKENGTGLGLAVCFSIAARHNAKIDIQTGPTGTTFFVRFTG